MISIKTPNIIEIFENHAEIIIDSPKYGTTKALVDIEDISKVKDYKWCVNNSKYKNVMYVGHTYKKNGKTKTIRLHRLITDCPEDLVVDHINHNGLDNRKCNLKICTIAENGQNRRLAKNNTSGINGVSWNSEEKKWRASVIKYKKQVFCKLFSNKQDAVDAINKFNNNEKKEGK